MGHKGKQRGGWKRRLQDLIDANNGRHSTRGKVVAHKTRDDRAASLFRIFRQLRAMGFKIEDPTHLGGRHIVWLMREWTADPTLKAELAAHGVRYEPRDKPLSPPYIQQQLSFLRGSPGGSASRGSCYQLMPMWRGTWSRARRRRSATAAGPAMLSTQPRCWRRLPAGAHVPH